jgi:hydrogenase-1 operon protein HyaE
MNEIVDTETVAPAAPLVTRLVERLGACWVDNDTVEDFASGRGDHVLFFSGDPVRFPEGLDVAVVLPELQRVFKFAFDIGVVVRKDEDAVARRYGERRWPSLVFLRDGQYVQSLPGMHDWTDFVAQVGQALAAPVRRVPGVGIPVVSGDAASSCH